MIGLFHFLYSKFKLENTGFITLQMCVTSCWLNIGMYCHFVYTISFCPHAIEIKLLVWCLRNVTVVFWTPLQCFF